MLVHAAHLRMSLLNRSFSDFAARHLHDGLLLPVVMLERVPAVLLRIGEAHDLLLGGRLDGVGGEQHGCADAQAALRELGAAAGENALAVGQDAEDAEVFGSSRKSVERGLDF